MYALDWSTLLTRPRSRAVVADPDAAASAPRPVRTRWLAAVSGTVWALGFTSLFTDISSEMIASILPLYLVLQLGLTPLAFGFVDGLYQGVAALVRVGGGVLADRWRRHKELAAAGYTLSALCRPAMLAVGSAWGALAGIVAVDRIGKGIRTAPRDALISRRSAPEGLATAFGVHRGLDAVGAMLGPVVAFAILANMPGAYDVLFLASFAVALVGLAIILLFVPAVAPERETRGMAISFRLAFDLLRARRFRAVVIAGFLLGIPTMSDSFVYLALQQRMQIAATAFPLFYVVTALFTASFAVPCGRVADRFGRGRVLLAGYVLLAGVYATVFLPPVATAMALVPLVLLGAYYAATDGVLTAMAASVLAPEAAGSGLALLATSTNIARLLASVLFGVLWTRAGIGAATSWYLGALALAIVSAGVVLHRARSHADVAVSSSIVTP